MSLTPSILPSRPQGPWSRRAARPGRLEQWGTRVLVEQVRALWRGRGGGTCLGGGAALAGLREKQERPDPVQAGGGGLGGRSGGCAAAGGSPRRQATCLPERQGLLPTAPDTMLLGLGVEEQRSRPVPPAVVGTPVEDGVPGAVLAADGGLAGSWG